MKGPLIFTGSTVKSLKSILDFFGNAQIHSGSVDPSSVATSAPRGSLYLNTSNGITYQKQDTGSTTNWLIFSTNSSTNLDGGSPTSTYNFSGNISGGTL